jgi:hypothetical protein
MNKEAAQEVLEQERIKIQKLKKTQNQQSEGRFSPRERYKDQLFENYDDTDKP